MIAARRDYSDDTLATVDSQIDTTTPVKMPRSSTTRRRNSSQPVHERWLLVDTETWRTLMPIAAVQRGSQGNFVFVVQTDKTMGMRSHVGRRTAPMLQSCGD
jgi:multidrug efflux system membrane fusion protein